MTALNDTPAITSEPEPESAWLHAESVAMWLLGCGVPGVLLFQVVPKFKEVFSQIGPGLPRTTEWVVWVSDALRTVPGACVALTGFAGPLVLYARGWQRPLLRDVFRLMFWLALVAAVSIGFAMFLPLSGMLVKSIN